MDGLPEADVGGGALGHGQLQPQRVLAHDGEDGRAGGAILAGEGMAFANDAVDRRAQRRVVELLARERELGSALREHGLPVAHLFERILIAAFGNLELRVGAFEIGARRDAALHERRDALALPARFVERRPAPDARARSSRCSIVVALADRIEAEPRPRLLQRGFRLAMAKLEVGGRQTREHLALRAPASQGRRAALRDGRSPSG